jgi:hypothetical protein
MMALTEWKKGDRVRHSSKPEWGVGEVLSVEGLVQDGQRCQRLSVRFDRAGLKTLSTAYADLVAVSEKIRTLAAELGALNAANPPASADDKLSALIAKVAASDDQGPLVGADGKSVEEVMAALPDRATDPFITLRKRLEVSLALYKFTPTGASLIDWATVQSGLRDPLSKFSRQDLESLFRRFVNALDQHVRKLGKEYKRQDPAGWAELIARADAPVKQALRRVDVDR